MWNGASAILSKYHKRKNTLERHTAETAKEAVNDFLEKRKSH